MTEWEADQAMYFPFHLHNQGLLVGLLLAFAVTMRPEWFRRADDAGWSWRGTWIAVAMAVVGLGLRAASGLVFSYTALALIYGGLVVFVLFDRSWFSRLTGGWPWYLVSRLSYGMYLNHLMFGSAIIVAATRALRQAQLGDTATYLLALGLTIALSMAMALCTFLLVEHPFLLLRERLVRRAPGAPTATVASAGSLAAMVPPLSGAPSREPALDAPRR
jgi:peptidoglycan/LPS O-acetylase OafA/YrhL